MVRALMERSLPRHLIQGVLVLVLAAAVPALSACSAKEADSDLVAGKKLFVEKCGSCHVLARAGTKGTSGPNLDEAFQQAQKEGFGETAIRGIIFKQIQFPSRGIRPCEPECVRMPADLVKGDDASDVAAYVAQVVSKPGKDTGLLATAVKAAGSGKPAVAKAGVLTIEADPAGQLAYVTTSANAPAGELTVRSPNKSGTPHDIVIDGKGDGDEVQGGGVSEFTARFTPGTYEFYCSVAGHKEAGMAGKLTVK